MNIFPLWEFGARGKRVVVVDQHLNMEDVGHVRVARCGQPEALDGREEVWTVFGTSCTVS